MRYDVSLTNFNDGASRAHLIRYFFARGFVTPEDEVIDSACGTGYGSMMLSKVAKKVYAFDQLDEIRYKENNIEYQKVDLASQYDYPDVDVAISLETIEHLTQEGSRVFLDSLLPHVRKMFVFSVPLHEEPGANPFHLQTFNEGSAWTTVLRPGWKQFHTLMQGNHLLGVLWR